MKHHSIIIFRGLLLCIATISIATSVNGIRGYEDGKYGGVRGCYYPSWVSKTFPPSSIQTSLFTHIYYAFLSPSNSTYSLLVPDSPLLSNFTSDIRRKSPTVKTLISIGGAGDGPTLFATIASAAPSRKAFIDSSIKVARDHGFDGLDLDWEFPQNPKEMRDLARLFHDWRAAIRHEARSMRRPPLLLTAAVYFSAEFFLWGTPRTYPIHSIRRNLDWINAMCYDYHGSWDPSATGAQAAFFDPSSNISSSYGLGSWLRSGLPGQKIVMGLPLYGRTWKLKSSRVNEVGAPAVGVGPGDDGVLFYRQVESFNKDNNATVRYDPTTVSAYSFAGTSWVGYDNAVSTGVKVRLAKGLGLRGYFFWALSYDDSHWQISTQEYANAIKQGMMRTKLKNPTTRPIPVAVRRRSFTEPPTQPMPAANLLMGDVKILKRGEPLTTFLPARSDLSPEKDLETASTTRSARGDLSLGSTNRLGPDPETVNKELPTTIPGKGFATGAYVTSPHPSLVPVPGFLSGAEIATHGLRRLLGVGLA